MSKKFSVFLALAWVCLALSGCKTIESASLFVAEQLKTEPDPNSARLGQINAEMSDLESQLTKLHKDRQDCEVQRFESLMEMGKISGMGPKMPGQFGEDQIMDVGSYYKMHNDAVTVANAKIKEIDADQTRLRSKMSSLRAERTRLEQAQQASAKSSFASPGGCFTPDTAVPLRSGAKAIAAIAPGEEVMVADEATGRIDYRPVLNTFRFSEDHYFLLNGEVRATALHRFMTEDGWVRVKYLKEGMQLKTASGWVVLASKKLIEAPVDVFNLEVADHHVFFVAGEREIYLVHNTGGGK
jgi:prefoldin subunit 5